MAAAATEKLSNQACGWKSKYLGVATEMSVQSYFIYDLIRSLKIHSPT